MAHYANVGQFFPDAATNLKKRNFSN